MLLVGLIWVTLVIHDTVFIFFWYYVCLVHLSEVNKNPNNPCGKTEVKAKWLDVQSLNEFWRTLITREHNQKQMDQHGGVLTARALLHQEHSPTPLFFVQSVFASFLKSMLKCISKDHFRQLPWLLFASQGLCGHISRFAFRRSERPKVHRVSCRWGRLIGLKIKTYGFFQDLDFLNTCLK